LGTVEIGRSGRCATPNLFLPTSKIYVERHLVRIQAMGSGCMIAYGVNTLQKRVSKDVKLQMAPVLDTAVAVSFLFVTRVADVVRMKGNLRTANLYLLSQQT